jgi:hypothetical protein
MHRLVLQRRIQTQAKIARLSQNQNQKLGAHQIMARQKQVLITEGAVGQLARYIGWVQQTIGRDRKVSGVIVAKTISQNLRFAVSVVPNVSLLEYQVEFHLRPAHQISLATD